jgi:hypothetical protein
MIKYLPLRALPRPYGSEGAPEAMTHHTYLCKGASSPMGLTIPSASIPASAKFGVSHVQKVQFEHQIMILVSEYDILAGHCIVQNYVDG